MKIRRSICILGVIGFSALCALPAMARMDGSPTVTEDKNMVMYLGNVEVRGQEKITKTLQAIKVALDMPYSNDPKLADVMVCRLEEKAGSHVQQILICGTNRILSKQRAALQMHMAVAVTLNSHGGPCTSIDCYSGVFDELNETLDSMPGHYLKTTVDGSALHGLLQQVPYPPKATPDEEKAPAAATNAQ
jgi:hypothetical protein